jgi:hypothetical protein
MKKVELTQDLISKTRQALDGIEKDVFGEQRGLRVKSDLRAGKCAPGTCPIPLYGVPVD